MDLYINSSIRLTGVVLNQLSTRKTLPDMYGCGGNLAYDLVSDEYEFVLVAP
jgi:hypothetical protein